LSQAGVLEPLGMHASSYLWQARFEPHSATNYDREGLPRPKYKPEQANAAYSLNTTPADLARFVGYFLSQPRTPLPGAASIAAMLTPQIPANDLAPWHAAWPDGAFTLESSVFWGLGWGIQRWNGEDAFFHWGDNGDAHAFAIAFRRRRAGMVAMVNSAHGQKLWPRLFSAVFGADLPAIAWLEKMYP
jgi:hypothetical protein